MVDVQYSRRSLFNIHYLLCASTEAHSTNPSPFHLGDFQSVATFVGMLPLTFLYVSSGANLAIGQGFTLTLGAIMVVLFFVLPRWIERKNLFGLREAFEHVEESEVAEV